MLGDIERNPHVIDDRSNGSWWQKLNSPQKYCRVGRGSFTLSPSQNRT
ncbi:hypothetical protein ACVIU7_009678 [Bradyrhizobium liaoningense]|nr:hypothetical protein QIH91_42610 [Bradyrhizobium japonicum USDA 135]